MQDKIISNIQTALKGKKIVRLAHTLDEGLDLTVLPEIPQEVWYKYPTIGEDIIKPKLEEQGIKCVRPFPNSHRDRAYFYDHLVWKMMADGYTKNMEKEPIFFCYKNSTHLDEVCQEYGFRSFMPSYALFKELQHKGNLEKYGVSEGAGLIPFFEKPLGELNYQDILAQFGLPFVVQFSFAESGWNTYGSKDTHIIKSEEDLENVQAEYASTLPAKVSKFIKGMPAATIVVNTAKGSLVNAPYFQITGEPTLVQNDKAARLLFCGGNYRHGGNLSQATKDKILAIGQNMGKELYKKQYRGIFGLDVMIEEGTGDVYVLEINPRFSGTTMSTNLLAKKNDQIPLIAVHFAEYLECLPESFNLEDYQKEIMNQEDFAYFFLRSREGKAVQVERAPQTGIYKITKDGIEFQGEGYSFEDLPDKDHFLITKICPRHRNIPSSYQLCEIWTMEDAFDDIILNEKYRNVSNQVYELFEFAPENSYDSSVPYKMH